MTDFEPFAMASFQRERSSFHVLLREIAPNEYIIINRLKRIIKGLAPRSGCRTFTKKIPARTAKLTAARYPRFSWRIVFRGKIVVGRRTIKNQIKKKETMRHSEDLWLQSHIANTSMAIKSK